MNYFVTAETAERYARGRPYLHPGVVQRVVAITGNLPRALDVGCGTGMSSTPLVQLARLIVGVDCSIEMLAHARPGAGLHYAAATAEMLPFQAGTFDLVTAGLAFHWFDRSAFLAEARRILTPGGWLVIYNNWFKGPSHPNLVFDRWWKEQYLRRYPTPARHSARPTDVEARTAGFTANSDSEFDSGVSMSIAGLVAYLTTQTNVIAALQSGAESVRSATDWLMESVRPVIESEEAHFLFGHSLWVFRRRSIG